MIQKSTNKIDRRLHLTPKRAEILSKSHSNLLNTLRNLVEIVNKHVLTLLRTATKRKNIRIQQVKSKFMVSKMKPQI